MDIGSAPCVCGMAVCSTPLFISVLMVEISAPVLVFQLSRRYTVINRESCLACPGMLLFRRAALVLL